VTGSKLIDHLLERRGEVADHGAARPAGEASPDVAGLDGRSSSASRQRATRSSMASAVSLVPVTGGRGRRLVAAIGIIRRARPPWLTKACPHAAGELVTDTTGKLLP
jgi:hypothetical protein